MTSATRAPISCEQQTKPNHTNSTAVCAMSAAPHLDHVLELVHLVVPCCRANLPTGLVHKVKAHQLALTARVGPPVVIKTGSITRHFP
jgi:hypothetical protein